MQIVKTSPKRNVTTCKENEYSSSSKQHNSFMPLPFWMEDGVKLGREGWDEGKAARLLEDVETEIRSGKNPARHCRAMEIHSRVLRGPWSGFCSKQTVSLSPSHWIQPLPLHGREGGDGEITITVWLLPLPEWLMNLLRHPFSSACLALVCFSFFYVQRCCGRPWVLTHFNSQLMYSTGSLFC